MYTSTLITFRRKTPVACLVVFLLILSACGGTNSSRTNNSATITQTTPVYSSAYDSVPTSVPANHQACPRQTANPPLVHHLGFVQDLNGDQGQNQFSQLHPGVTKTKAWLVRNNGTKAWPRYTQFLPLWAVQNPTIPPILITTGTAAIPVLKPGEFGITTLAFTTPQTTGNYLQVFVIATATGDAVVDALSLGFSV